MECIICAKPVNDRDKSVVQNPRIQGMLSIINSAEKRNDDCGRKILAKRNDILNGTIKVKYHVSCRQSYTSEQNMTAVTSKTKITFKTKSQTRSTKDPFNIRTMCFICNKSGTRKKQNLIQVQTGI